MMKTASYKCRTGEETFNLPGSLKIVSANCRGEVQGIHPWFSTHRDWDQPNNCSTNQNRQTHFVPYCTSKQENLIPAPQWYPSTTCPCCIQTLPMLHSVAFLPPCSEIPNFAAKIQQRRKLTFLHDSPRVPSDLTDWEQQGLHLIPQGKALTG